MGKRMHLKKPQTANPKKQSNFLNKMQQSEKTRHQQPKKGMNTLVQVKKKEKITFKEKTLARLDVLKKKFDIDDDMVRLGPNNRVTNPVTQAIYFNTNDGYQEYFKPMLKKYEGESNFEDSDEDKVQEPQTERHG